MSRVLHITRDFPPCSKGGISTAVGGMARASVAAGLACAVISFDAWRPKSAARSRPPAPEPLPAGLPELPPGSPDAPDLPLLRVTGPDDLAAAHAFAARFAPSVLHVHHGMLWEFAAELRDHLGAPAFLHVHVLQKQQNRLRGVTETTLSLAAQEQALDQADCIIAPSRTVVELLLADHPGCAARIEHVRLAVSDTEPARRAAFAPETRTPDTVLYAGRFADINGTAELFAAIPAILARVPKARFVIAGGVPDNPKAQARWHKRWQSTAPTAVQERVRFTGWLPPDRLAELYATATVLISPSWFETFGLVVLEAMLHGTAVSGTRCGGTAELIEHDRTGLLAPPRDPERLADNTAALLADPGLAATLGRAAATSVRSHHLWDSVIPDLARLYAAAQRR